MELEDKGRELRIRCPKKSGPRPFKSPIELPKTYKIPLRNALGPTKVQQEFCRKWMVYWHAVFDLSLMYIVICYAVATFPHWMFYEGQELICGGRLGQLLHLILLILSVGIPRESVAQKWFGDFWMRDHKTQDFL